jgi:hypothetical protein
MNLSDYMPQEDVVLGLAQRVKRKYPEKGSCAFIARDLVKELLARGVSAKHVCGNFYLDEPGSFIFIAPLDIPTDEYTVNHDWVEVDGKIVDAAATQFRKYVNDEIPEIVIANHTHPLYVKYDPIKYIE